MQKWEHMVIAHNWDEEAGQYYWDEKTDQRPVPDRLNDLGEEGWQLAGIHTHGPGGSVYYFLKRPKE